MNATSAREQLTGLMQDPDPYRYASEDIQQLQIHAMAELLEVRRRQIRVLDQRVRDAGVDSITSFEDVVPLLFAHTTYKSYPDSFVARRRWDLMNQWLDTLSTRRVREIDVSGATDVDDWIARLRDGGHHVFGTSGTSGKTSFLNQTERDREVTRLTQVLNFTWATGAKPDRSRPVFLLGPRYGYVRFVDAFLTIEEEFGRAGAAWYLSDEPLRAADVNRIGAMRKSIAEGTATPGEIASLEREASERQERMQASLVRLVDTIVAHRHEPLIIMGLWQHHYTIMVEAKKKGVGDGEFRPESAFTVGGGLKGVTLPSDYQDQVRRFYGVDPSRYQYTYGMQEMSTTLPMCEARRYHTPPWIVLLALDASGEKLLDPGRGPVEGRMAFCDLAIEGRWGGLISGDRITAHFGSCPCGRRSPQVLDSVVRYTEAEGGDDKLTCAGTIESYVRGIIQA